MQRYSAGTASCDEEQRLLCVREQAHTLSELGYGIGPFQTLTPQFQPRKLGTYTAELKVTDGCQLSTTSVEVTVKCPEPPVVSAGDDVISYWSRPNKTHSGFRPVHFSGNIPMDGMGIPLDAEWTQSTESFFTPPSTDTEYISEFDIPQALVDQGFAISTIQNITFSFEQDVIGTS